MLKKLFLAAMLVMAALATGCASVPMAGADQDAKMKTFAAPVGTSNIYIYRNEAFGGAIKMDVRFDDKAVGQTASKTYFVVPAAPGKHTIVSKAESESTLDITTEAGKNYYVWQEVKMGILTARSKLQIVDEAAGKAGVQDCKLIATN